MEKLILHPNHAPAFTRLGLRDFGSFVRQFLPGPIQPAKVTVQPGLWAGGSEPMNVYFKLYDHGRGDWGFWWRASKARREFENYQTLAQLGVPAAEALACGEERDTLGRLRRAFILTRAVPASVTLIDFFQSRPNQAHRQQVLRQLAEMTWTLHGAGFFYYDLVWRNILVSQPPGQPPEVVLIDCPRGGLARTGHRHKRLRDLASLDKSAWRFCSRAERLRFLLAYLGQPRLDDAARQLLTSGLRYRRERWPEDWAGK